VGYELEAPRSSVLTAPLTAQSSQLRAHSSDSDIRHRRGSLPMLAFEMMPEAPVITGTRGRSLDVANRPAPTALTTPPICGAWAALHDGSTDLATKRNGAGVQSSCATVTSRRHFGFSSVCLIVGDCGDNRLSYSNLCGVFCRGTWRHVPCFDERQTSDRRDATSRLSCQGAQYPSYWGNEQWLTSR